MGKIFKGQTKLKITLDLEQNITGAKQTLIKYKKPNGTEGQWTATVEDAVLGILSYEPASELILDQSGPWVIWGWVEFSDDRVAAGEPVTLQINAEGK